MPKHNPSRENNAQNKSTATHRNMRVSILPDIIGLLAHDGEATFEFTGADSAGIVAREWIIRLNARGKAIRAIRNQKESNMAKGQKALQRDAKTELDRDGIERIPVDAFLWRGYRSTHARDAIAAAKRAVKQ